MTLALITDAWYPQVNGVVRTLDTVRTELMAMGHPVEVIAPQDFRTIACPTYPEIRLSVNAPWTLPRKLDALAPEQLHIATEGPLGLAARRYCLKRGLRFTTSYHTRFAEYLERRLGIPERYSTRALRWFHAPASTVLVASASMRAELDARGFTNTKAWTRGVDTTRFYPESDEVARLALLPYPRPIWLYVGRVSLEKNLDDFLQIDLPGTKLVVGDGPARAALMRTHPDAIFLGMKQGEDLRRCYAGSDVFVFPSRWDTFGVVMLEALACGTPVAAYPVTGPKDAITDPRAGILAENLHEAAIRALTLNRADCLAYAKTMRWRRVAEIFLETLVPVRA